MPSRLLFQRARPVLVDATLRETDAYREWQAIRRRAVTFDQITDALAAAARDPARLAAVATDFLPSAEWAGQFLNSIAARLTRPKGTKERAQAERAQRVVLALLFGPRPQGRPTPALQGAAALVAVRSHWRYKVRQALQAADGEAVGVLALLVQAPALTPTQRRHLVTMIRRRARPSRIADYLTASVLQVPVRAVRAASLPAAMRSA